MKSKIHSLKKVIAPQTSDCTNNTWLVKHNEKKSPGSYVDFTEKKYGYIKKTLVADDDVGIIDVLKLMLEAAGYKVYASVNGPTVLDVNEICPNLILLDILISGINGHDICKLLRNE